LEYAPDAVMLAFSDPTPYADRIRESGACLMVQVTDLEEARRAADLGADLIMAQVTEAGGHGAVRRRSTLPFVPAAVDLVGPVPVLAAALVLGAAGAVVGTRFHATTEALVTPPVSKALLEGRAEDTERSTVLDRLRGSAWPSRYSARPLGHPHLDRWRGRGAEVDTPRARQEYQADLSAGAIPPRPMWAGESVDLVNDLPSAEELVTGMGEQAQETLARF